MMRMSEIYQNYVIDKLKNRYQHEQLSFWEGDEETVFTRKNGYKFIVSIFPMVEGEESLVIEYQCDPNEVRSQYCDGDRFFISDMSKEEMYEAMLKEIEDD